MNPSSARRKSSSCIGNEIVPDASISAMSKGGYSKLLTKLQESNAENLRLRAEILEREQRIAAMDPTVPEKNGHLSENRATTEKKSKLIEFWTSTPVWGALAVPAAFIVSSWSVKAVYALVWAVLCFEFIRLRVGTSKRMRFTANSLFPAILASGFVVGWPYLPKPKSEPDLDRKLSAFGGTLSDEIVRRLSSSALTISSSQPRTTLAAAHPSVHGEVLSIALEQFYRFDGLPPKACVPYDMAMYLSITDEAEKDLSIRRYSVFALIDGKWVDLKGQFDIGVAPYSYGLITQQDGASIASTFDLRRNGFDYVMLQRPLAKDENFEGWMFFNSGLRLPGHNLRRITKVKGVFYDSAEERYEWMAVFPSKRGTVIAIPNQISFGPSIVIPPTSSCKPIGR